MKKNNLLLTTLVVAIIGFSSCNKSDVFNTSKDFGRYKVLSSSEILEAFYEFYNEDFDGQILIQDNHNFQTESSQNLYISGRFTNLDISEISVNSIVLSEKDENGNFDFIRFDEELEEIYGQVVQVQAPPYFTDEFYIPERIYASREAGYVGPGSEITWNEDPSNTQGVIIMVDFSNFMQLGENFEGYDDVCMVELTGDDGSFTLTGDFFTDIPEGAYFTLRVVRGNYKMMISGEGLEAAVPEPEPLYNSRLLAYTSASSLCVYQN